MLRKGANKIIPKKNAFETSTFDIGLVDVGQNPSFLWNFWHLWTNKHNSFCYDSCRIISHPLATTWSCFISWSNRALHHLSLVSESWHFASNYFGCWAPCIPLRCGQKQGQTIFNLIIFLDYFIASYNVWLSPHWWGNDHIGVIRVISGNDHMYVVITTCMWSWPHTCGHYHTLTYVFMTTHVWKCQLLA